MAIVVCSLLELFLTIKSITLVLNNIIPMNYGVVAFQGLMLLIGLINPCNIFPRQIRTRSAIIAAGFVNIMCGALVFIFLGLTNFMSFAVSVSISNLLIGIAVSSLVIINIVSFFALRLLIRE